MPDPSRLILAIDTSDRDEAVSLARTAKVAGATTVKLGLEALTALGPRTCAAVAKVYELDWVCDAKLHDIPQTVERTVANLCSLDPCPVAITVHASGGVEMMHRANRADIPDHLRGRVKLLAVTVLTSIDDDEVDRMYHITEWATATYSKDDSWARWARQECLNNRRIMKVLQYAHDAYDAGVAGLVCAPADVCEVRDMYPNAWLMVPGTRSKGADAGDQKNITTPAEALAAGADALVIGSQVTKAENPHKAFQAILDEIGAGA